MSLKQSSAVTDGGEVLSEERQSVYNALFNKINLSPVSALGDIEVFQSNEVLSDTSADERVTAAVSVFLDLLKASSRTVDRLDKTAA